jgi:YD repeat-containing protein
MAQVYAKSICGSYPVCQLTFIGERWSAPLNNWQWTGVVDYTIVYPSAPPQSFSVPVAEIIGFFCPSDGGWSLYNQAETPGICTRDIKQPDCETCKANAPSIANAPSVGDPVFPSTGVLQEIEVDYKNASGTLSFVRTYRSDQNKWGNNFELSVLDLHQNRGMDTLPSGACFLEQNYSVIEQHCYAYAALGTVNDVAIKRGNSRMRYFSSGNQFSTVGDNNQRITQRFTDDGTVFIGWTVKNGDTDTTETYDTSGRIRSSVARDGKTTLFTYSEKTTAPSIAKKEGLLITVTDAYGSALNFTYDDAFRLSTMIDPSGAVYEYSYDGKGNLGTVKFPDGKSKKYLYNETAQMPQGFSMPTSLTGIIDENGTRHATITYGNGYAPISTELAGGVDKYKFSLISQATTTTNVTDPLGTVRTYFYNNTLFSVKRFMGISQPGPAGGPSVSSSLTYDANANVSSYTDFNGNKTTYSYDLTRNLPLTQVDAAGTTFARTTTTAWHPTLALPIKIAETKRLTIYTYDANGNVLTHSVQATTDANGALGFSAALTGTARVWTYTYNQLGQVLTAKGPRSGVNDTTSYTYDELGNLTSVTNAAGHVTTLSNYDPNGHVGRITDPNGLVTDLSYTPRGWLASRAVGDQNTSYSYDGVGQLTQVALPDNSTITYAYDGAHRLTNIADSLGNSITYFGRDWESDN